MPLRGLRNSAGPPDDTLSDGALPDGVPAGQAASPGGGAAVSLRNVAIGYVVNGRRFTAVKNASFDVAPGQMLCIIGPSGCGKTSLLHAIAGLTPYSAGQILIGGRTVSGPGQDRAVVFQRPALLPWKSVQANAAYGLRLYRQDRKSSLAKAARALETVGLKEFMDHYPHQLSGGMQQRANLARALAADPDIMLFDEPFASLDAQQRDLLQAELLRVWQSAHKTGIFITHQIDEAVLLADQVIVLSPGPASVIVERILIDFPRPRSNSLRLDPAFTEQVGRIRSLLDNPAP